MYTLDVTHVACKIHMNEAGKIVMPIHGSKGNVPASILCPFGTPRHQELRGPPRVSLQDGAEPCAPGGTHRCSPAAMPSCSEATSSCRGHRLCAAGTSSHHTKWHRDADVASWVCQSHSTPDVWTWSQAGVSVTPLMVEPALLYPLHAGGTPSRRFLSSS